MFYFTMKNLKNVIVALVLCSLVSTQSKAGVYVPASATKIFESDFTGTWFPTATKWVTAEYPFGNWTGTIAGANWGTLPVRVGQENYYNFAVKGDKILGNYVGCTRTTVTMPWGSSADVHTMAVWQNDPDTTAVSRVQYNWFPEDGTNDLYFSYYIKLQSNLASSMSDIGEYKWRLLMEFREFSAPDVELIRSELAIIRKKINGVYTLCWDGNVSRYPSFISVARESNTTVPIPVDKWFLLTVHYKHHATDGAFEASIQVCADGGGFEGPQQTLFSMTGIQTTTGRGLDFANFMKIYAGTNVLSQGGIWQYIYFVRIWDNTQY
ncbi:MAG: hypothetical protein L3J71_11390 [Victivallaceae bacterium]|nr:hypothetical protein [Victivallaceae bacterium]